MQFDHLFKEILKAPIYDLVKHTPLEYARFSSRDLGHEIYHKREDLQDIFSFKIRGAYNKIRSLSDEEKERGVICVSAGNHGQGVALAGSKLGVSVQVVMPVTTPQIKVSAVKSFGGDVVLYGDSYSDAEKYCHQLIHEHGLTLIHPFDDPLVIAGQGTIGREILDDCPDLDMVFAPVGGGGLLAGLALYLKAIRPEIKLIGVEPEESNGMQQSLQYGSVVTLEQTGTFADGVAVKTVGSQTFPIINELVDDWVCVSTDEICSAIEYMYLDSRTILEPAGALSLAGAKRYLREQKGSGKKVACIASGANMNFQRLQFVAERVLTGDDRESLYQVELAEESGALYKFCDEVLGHKAITEFNYRQSQSQKAHIFVGVSQKPQDREGFAQRLDQFGYQWTDLTSNDLAKDHIRHMVGGVQYLSDELLFSFRFPERPGALTHFLSRMNQGWNISLFHYRCHGGDYGKVLLGLQVPAAEEVALRSFVAELGYPAEEQSQNEAYRYFLNPEEEGNHD